MFCFSVFSQIWLPSQSWFRLYETLSLCTEYSQLTCSKSLSTKVHAEMSYTVSLCSGETKTLGLLVHSLVISGSLFIYSGKVLKIDEASGIPS